MVEKRIKPRISLKPPVVKETKPTAVVKAKPTTILSPAKPVLILPDKISKPGFVDGMSEEFYHGDCCETPSISNSMAKLLDDESPQKMFANSYLDPNREIKENKNFDMGHALHKVFLEPELFDKAVVEIEFEDYKKDEAKRQRMLIRESGRIPLLTKDLRTVYLMREALMEHPIAKKAFNQGVAERSYFAKDKETGVWMKCRVDWDKHSPRRIFCDYKTTASANPDDFENSVWNFGYHIQQPWYLEVVEQATGEVIDEWYFIAQEKEYPYAVSIFEVKPQAIEYGKKIMRRSLRKFADCLSKGVWHGYRDKTRPDTDGVITIDLPTRAYFQLAEREERDDFQ